MSMCEACGQNVQVGEWPWCPHGFATPQVIDDTLPGGARYMHNLGPEPVWVETKTQLTAELKARGLVQAERKTYNRRDQSPWATRTRLRPGMTDPFLPKE